MTINLQAELVLDNNHLAGELEVWTHTEMKIKDSNQNESW